VAQLEVLEERMAAGKGLDEQLAGGHDDLIEARRGSLRRRSMTSRKAAGSSSLTPSRDHVHRT